jgi:hypothetical protein
MTDPHRHTVAAVAACLAAGLLLAACSKSTPAAQTTSSVQTTAAATDATSVAATNAASAQATPPAAATDATSVAATNAVSARAIPRAAYVAGGNACSLVTEADATTALGTDPGPGTGSISAHGSSQCDYGTLGRTLVLVNITPTQGKLAYDNFRNNPDIGKPGSVVDVAGVGDKAFEVDSHGSAGIFFRKGDALVAVSVVFYLVASPPTDQVRALAKVVAGRI